ncbi:MAG: dicarboxylate/amino acid:cation symporter [Methylophilaceae bacterium]|jgi:Na+/H+-dicarboxylate symporter|nr:MAG: dicarboxylate/amino acid:cation symporter [Methylophilaceae bacterium]
MKLPSLNIQIFLGALFGVLIGLLLQKTGIENTSASSSLYAATIVGTLFIDLLKMILIPLVFCSIVVGIANLRQHQQMHAVWISTLVFFVFTMVIAMIVGMAASNYFQPGAGLAFSMFEGAMQNFQAQQMPLSAFLAHFLHNLFVNPFQSLAEGKVLSVVIFALFLGIALVMGGERYRNILVLLEEALEVTMRMVNWIMYLAPYGIAALLIQLIATQDVSVLGTLAKFVAVVAGTLLFHGVIMLPLLLFLLTGKSPIWFWKGARQALITAFATSSSSATLPITIRCATEQLDVKPEIAGFVIPLGATMNMDGTALYEAAAALFVANLVGVDLSFTQQLIVFFTAMIASIGAPGIPSAGMVTMVLVLQSVGLPAEAIAILLPVDRMLDTLRTTVNVEGDMTASLVVQKIVS